MKDIGLIINNLEVVGIAEKYVLPCGQKNKAFLVKCHCGNLFRTRALHFVRGKVGSCGCSFNLGEKGLIKIAKHKQIKILWRSIRFRCGVTNSKNNMCTYHLRGIRMCDEWYSNYEKFEEWAINNGYKKGLDIDRIDNYKGYSPDNCRFVTRTQNSLNKRNNTRVIYNGESKVLLELADSFGIRKSYAALRSRLKRGWDVHEALTTPFSLNNKKKITNKR